MNGSLTLLSTLLAGKRDYKYPGVKYTQDELRNVTWSGKRTFTRDEHIHMDRIRVPHVEESYDERYERLLSRPILILATMPSPLLYHRYLERCEEVRRDRPDKLKDHPRPKATYHLIPPSKTTQEVHKYVEKMRKQGNILRSPDLRVTSHNGAMLAYNTDTVLLVPAKSAPCHQAALMFATGCTLQQLGKVLVCLFARTCTFVLNILTRLRCTSDAPRHEGGIELQEPERSSQRV